MASHLLATEKGLPFVGLPIFPRRVFRHSSIYINPDSGISTPQELEGKKVGIHLYQNTAAVWVKGILQHFYGVSLDKITWVAEELEEYRIGISLPSNIRIEVKPAGKDLEKMLVDGELDAVITPRPPGPFLQGSKKVKRLFENYREVEEQYYRETKIFPIHHTVVMKRSVWEEHPWVAVNILRAFREAKQRCYDLRYWPGRYSMAWASSWLENERKTIGSDPWPYDLGNLNRLGLETLIQYAHEQGVIAKRHPVESLFAPSCLEA